MHELSIAARLVDLATEHARAAGAVAVTAVTVRIGRLSCVHGPALESGFELMREGTPLAGARLRIVDVPVRVWCPQCGAEAELPDISRLACPTCGTRTGDIRAGRELDLESLDLEAA
jgi:hydrogenase nickel incorporation protein HypA/HybF